MFSPTAFESNEESMSDNHFMAASGGADASDLSPADAHDALPKRVVAEHQGLVAVLRDEIGATVHLFDHTEEHDTPDAVFPNNWFCTVQTQPYTEDNVTYPGGPQITLFPMRHPNRRKERREDLIQFLTDRYNVVGKRADQPEGQILDLTSSELDDPPQILEGTGALVLDRTHRVAYVCLSERADLDLAATWCNLSGYELIAFSANDEKGRPIYHTNVMMSVGTNGAIVCRPSLSDEEYKLVADKLKQTGRTIIDIDFTQMGEMCGNVLEIAGLGGTKCLLMSTRARDSFSQTQKNEIEKLWDSTHVSSIPTLEEVGGGGVRCCVAELF